MDQHTCTKCEETKPRTEFYKNKKKSAGISSWCKICQKKQARDRYYAKVRRTSLKVQRPRECEQCGEKFTPSRANNKNCSARCANRAWWKKSKELNAFPPRKCFMCGATFTPVRGGNINCSKQCIRYYENRVRGHHFSRARRYGVTYERIRKEIVFARDNWICGICDQPIDPDAKHPDPMSVSLDHIVPLSRGGTHTLENVQASHLHCNVRKGAKISELARESPES